MHIPRCQVLQCAVPLDIPLRSAESAWAGGGLSSMTTPACLDARLFIHAQDIILRPQRLGLPKRRGRAYKSRIGPAFGRIAVDPSEKANARYCQGLDGRLVQHPPHGTAADLFAQCRLRTVAPDSGSDCLLKGSSVSAIHFTRQGMDQRLIERGKKPACVHAPADLRWRKSPLAPATPANAVPAEAKGPTTSAASSFPRHGVLLKEQHQEKPLRPVPQRYAVEPCRVHLARNRRGKVQRAGIGPGIAASFPCRIFLGFPSLYQEKSYHPNHDVICETDH